MGLLEKEVRSLESLVFNSYARATREHPQGPRGQGTVTQTQKRNAKKARPDLTGPACRRKAVSSTKKGAIRQELCASSGRSPGESRTGRAGG